MDTKPKRMEEIRHLFDEIRQIQAKIQPLTGEAREKLTREWREFSDTLHSKLKQARTFRKDWLYFKYLDPQLVEVVLTPHAITIEPLNGCWLDAIYDSDICDTSDYAEAITQVLENEEVPCG